ncbi:hypothetical protein EGR_03182 [Echinococcus granulosus]|uniref:Uncharacterized protein n=1 Tax=Echinococcus granulosus TaxID=6210 RepID=W6V672_ECHGR|nr:hypothetical protein EGR_03182 [Echinococcus granulosus]EUB61909.1 hypothetical protein EGR_03182 [Echinococcus granulosus]
MGVASSTVLVGIYAIANQQIVLIFFFTARTPKASNFQINCFQMFQNLFILVNFMPTTWLPFYRRKYILAVLPS